MIPRHPSAPTPPSAHASGYIIHPLLPENGIMIISGGNEAGKTTLGVQIARDVQVGTHVLGYPSRPSAVAYVSLEHSPEYVGNIAKCTSADIPIMDFGIADYVSNDKRSLFEDICETARKQEPDLEVLFLDGLFSLLLKGDPSHYKPVRDLMEKTERSLRKHKLSLVAIVRSVKFRGNGAGFIPATDRVMGNSGAWISRAQTFVSIDEVSLDQDGDRRRSVLIVSGGVRTTQNWQFTSERILVPAIPSDSATSDRTGQRSDWESMLFAYPEGQEFKLEDLRDMAELFDMSDRTWRYWLDELVGQDRLLKPGRNRYQIPRRQ